MALANNPVDDGAIAQLDTSRFSIVQHPEYTRRTREAAAKEERGKGDWRLNRLIGDGGAEQRRGEEEKSPMQASHIEDG